MPGRSDSDRPVMVRSIDRGRDRNYQVMFANRTEPVEYDGQSLPWEVTESVPVVSGGTSDWVHFDLKMSEAFRLAMTLGRDLYYNSEELK